MKLKKKGKNMTELNRQKSNNEIIHKTLSDSENPIIRKQIGGKTYFVKVHFLKEGEELFQEKMERLIVNAVNYNMGNLPNLIGY